MKISKLLVAAALLLGAGAAHADPAKVVVTDVDGKTTSISLCDEMEGYYDYDRSANELKLRIVSGTFTYDENGNQIPDTSAENPGVVHLAMPVYKVGGLDFYGVDTAVDEIGADSNLTIDLMAGRLVFRGVTAPVDLTVSSLDGIMEFEEKVVGDKEIDMTALGSGVHLVKAGDKTFKMLVK